MNEQGVLNSKTITQDLNSGVNVIQHNLNKRIVGYSVSDNDGLVDVDGAIIDLNTFKVTLSGSEGISGAVIVFEYIGSAVGVGNGSPATITDSDGVTTFEVESGGTGACTPSEPINVSNSSGSYDQDSLSDIALPDIQFTDSDGSVSQVPSVVDIVATPLPVGLSTNWTRNPDWLPLPYIAPSERKFNGLLLIFEDEFNSLGVFSYQGSIDINWGDGVVESVSGITTSSHVYDYNTISSEVHQYYDGRNYKQVIVELNQTSGDTSELTIGYYIGSGHGFVNNFVDAHMNWDSVIKFIISAHTNTKAVILEKLIVKTHPTSSHNVSSFRFLYSLKSLDFNPASYLTMEGEMFYGINEMGDLNFERVTDLDNTFVAPARFSIGNITAPVATSMIGTFRYSYNLKTIGVIDAPLVEDVSYMFDGCYSLRGFEMLQCGSINTTLNAFNNCLSLSKLLLHGITVGFSIYRCMLTADNLNALFNSLGTANGEQEIVITDNPGANTCDTSIATNKGYTVIN